MSETKSAQNEFGTILDFHTVRFERLLPGPIERVWAYLTERNQLRTWLADSTIDLRVGGAVELRFDLDEVPERRKAGGVNRGFVTRYEPPHAFAYTWRDAAHATVESEVTFELETVGSQVRLVLTHRRLPARANASFGAGWHTHLAVLQARLLRETPPSFLVLFNAVMPAYIQTARDLPSEETA
ncbi:MAG: SRPBCC family protein [Chloroflexi bacterium]|nr:SRPBCC family protein [Chloroflexota bacterium]